MIFLKAICDIYSDYMKVVNGFYFDKMKKKLKIYTVRLLRIMQICLFLFMLVFLCFWWFTCMQASHNQFWVVRGPCQWPLVPVCVAQKCMIAQSSVCSGVALACWLARAVVWWQFREALYHLLEQNNGCLSVVDLAELHVPYSMCWCGIGITLFSVALLIYHASGSSIVQVTLRVWKLRCYPVQCDAVQCCAAWHLGAQCVTVHVILPSAHSYHGSVTEALVRNSLCYGPCKYKRLL